VVVRAVDGDGAYHHELFVGPVLAASRHGVVVGDLCILSAGGVMKIYNRLACRLDCFRRDAYGLRRAGGLPGAHLRLPRGHEDYAPSVHGVVGRRATVEDEPQIAGEAVVSVGVVIDAVRAVGGCPHRHRPNVAGQLVDVGAGRVVYIVAGTEVELSA